MPLPDSPRPVLLTILDGWGVREAAADNAISQANTPNWDRLSSQYPNGVLDASAKSVGLPDGQMGNSEVGHMNIGSGRVILQDLPRIDAAIAQDSLKSHPALQNFIATLKDSSGACHLMGLLSDGGVHAHMDHMLYLAKAVASAGITVHIHAFLDGRDTPPKSAADYLAQAEAAIADEPRIQISSICGRYHAMDRDKRWERVQKAYDMLVDGKGTTADNTTQAITASYANDITDEFVEPTVFGGYEGMQDGDGVLMANFRADRAREILTALLDAGFDGFTRNRTINFAATLGMVEYSSELAPLIPAIFPPEVIIETLGEVVANAGMKQLRIAETEKYAHVTFFLNAGREEEFAGEDRILVPSPKVATYDLQPEMSAYEVTEKLEAAIASDQYDLIVVNYANPDMVGHTGNLPAAIKAVEVVDDCLGRLADAVLPKGGVMLITADHGNIELMGETSPHTAHTLNLVPFIVAHNASKGTPTTLPEGKLCDIAPTVLQLLQLDQPANMTGESRLKALG